MLLLNYRVLKTDIFPNVRTAYIYYTE